MSCRCTRAAMVVNSYTCVLLYTLNRNMGTRMIAILRTIPALQQKAAFAATCICKELSMLSHTAAGKAQGQEHAKGHRHSLNLEVTKNRGHQNRPQFLCQNSYHMNSNEGALVFGNSHLGSDRICLPSKPRSRPAGHPSTPQSGVQKLV